MAGNILLLGGNGFIGGALVRKYAELGLTVDIISRGKAATYHPQIRAHQASLDDSKLLKALVPSANLIIHAASTCTPGTSASQPSKEVEENLLPLSRLLENLKQYAPRPLIFISSGGTVYGEPQNLPVAEDHPFRPVSYHGAAKTSAEHFLQVYARATGNPVTVLRPSNVYGPGQRGPLGFGIIRSVLQHLKSDTPMEIWGNGETIRDYLYIDDLVSALIQIHQQKCSGSFNVGTGIGHSLNEIIECAEIVAGRKLALIKKPARSLDVKSTVLDCTKITETTGWKAEVELEIGLQKTWAWLCQQP